MSGTDRRICIVHLAFDHASVRALNALLQSETQSEHWWWVNPNETSKDSTFAWHNALSSGGVLDKFQDADAVFIHRLKGENLKWLGRIPPHLPVIWASWGDDYYRVINSLNRSLFLPRTAALNALLGKMSISIQRIGNVFGGAEKRFVSACQRVDAVSTLMGKDAPFFGIFSKPSPRTYPSLYNPTPPESDLQWCATAPARVLIGTNASNTSNHLDVIVKLRKAMAPNHASFSAGLSYGSPRYGRAIDLLGRALLPNWNAQFAHLPRQAYADWLCTHSVLIMNNIRTQGTGVMVMALWYGLRIVVRSDAHIAPFLKQQGFVFDQIPAQGWDNSMYTPLKEEDRLHNRSVAAKVFGKAQQLNSAQALVSDLKTGQLTRRCP